MIGTLILFDCDGTLVDSEYLNLFAILEILKSFGIHDYDMDYGLTHFTGLRFSDIAKQITAQTGVVFPPNAAQLYLAKVRELSPVYMKPVEGAREVVALAAQHATICVVSNGERNNVLFSLEATNLREFFPDTHVFTGLMANPKPAPDLFLLAAERMGILPSQTLVIEDSVPGVRAGVAAGMTVWGFCGTHHDQDTHIPILKNLGAEKVYRSMKTLGADLEQTAFMVS